MKVMAKSIPCRKKTYFAWLGGLSLTAFAALVLFPSLFSKIGGFVTSTQTYKDIIDKYKAGLNLLPQEEKIIFNYDNATEYGWSSVVEKLPKDILIALLVCEVLFTLGVVAWVLLNKVSISVTENHIYYYSLWGKRTVLPINKVTAMGTNRFKGLFVSTASDRISLVLVANRKELLECISTLATNR